jgi:hypothetical protein
MIEELNINFFGYWREEKNELVPADGGVYCVYESTHHEESDAVETHRVLYIGEAPNVREAINEEGRIDEWKSHIDKNNELCFSYGPTKPDDIRVRIMAAFVYRLKPPLNEKYKDSFPFPPTRMLSNGAVNQLIIDFTLGEDS